LRVFLLPFPREFASFCEQDFPSMGTMGRR
jgi:hypothetical protein